MSPPNSTTIFLGKRVHHRNEADPLQRAMTIVGWKEVTKAEAAGVIWDVETLSDPLLSLELRPHQIINRVPAMLHCCRKAVFARVLTRLRAIMPPGSPLNDGHYLPKQWALPQQHGILAPLVEERAAECKRKGMAAPMYIVKPDGGSMGDGIMLTPEPCKASWNSANDRVVQEYIGAPLLLDGLKFDLRLYVLVTSTNPVRGYLYHEGLARFAVDAYVAPSKDNMRNVHMHLTNYSLNKKCDAFVATDEADGGEDGSKRTVSSVFEALRRAGVVADVDALWDDIAALVSRSLAVLQPILSAAQAEPAQRCFQVLGFDVLLDRHCRPWLIEINDHPSFRIDLSYDEPGVYSMNGSTSVPSPVDEAIKVRAPGPCSPEAHRDTHRDHPSSALAPGPNAHRCAAARGRDIWAPLLAALT